MILIYAGVVLFITWLVYYVFSWGVGYFIAAMGWEKHAKVFKVGLKLLFFGLAIFFIFSFLGDFLVMKGMKSKFFAAVSKVDENSFEKQALAFIMKFVGDFGLKLIDLIKWLIITGAIAYLGKAVISKNKKTE